MRGKREEGEGKGQEGKGRTLRREILATPMSLTQFARRQHC